MLDVTELVYEITITARDRETNADGVTASRLLDTLALAEELPPAEAVARLRALADRIENEAGERDHPADQARRDMARDSHDQHAREALAAALPDMYGDTPTTVAGAIVRVFADRDRTGRA